MQSFHAWYTREVRLHNRTVQLHELLGADIQVACSAAYYAGAQSAQREADMKIQDMQKTNNALTAANKMILLANEILMTQRAELREQISTIQFARLTRVK